MPPPPPAIVEEVEAGRLKVVGDAVRDGTRLITIDAPDPSIIERLTRDERALGDWSMDELPLEETFIELVRRPWA
jgi:hypothetical protein